MWGKVRSPSSHGTAIQTHLSGNGTGKDRLTLVDMGQAKADSLRWIWGRQSQTHFGGYRAGKDAALAVVQGVEHLQHLPPAIWWRGCAAVRTGPRSPEQCMGGARSVPSCSLTAGRVRVMQGRAERAQVLNEQTVQKSNHANAYTTIFWSLYLIVWILSKQGLCMLSNPQATLAYVVLDVLAKAAFAFSPVGLAGEVGRVVRWLGGQARLSNKGSAASARPARLLLALLTCTPQHPSQGPRPAGW